VIQVVRGELATTTAEAVLRPVSAEWTAVTPAMRRLELAAGLELERQCRTLGELPVGSAVITSAGELAAQFMIHVIVRSMEEPVTSGGVRRGLDNGLRRIDEWGIQRLAMAPLGTGAGNLDVDDAAAIIVPALIERIRRGHPPRDVEIYVDSDYEKDVFERHIATELAASAEDGSRSGPAPQ
jgi:O-acetyl-ADP-ribose deacetylase (regulator of RNase III)